MKPRRYICERCGKKFWTTEQASGHPCIAKDGKENYAKVQRRTEIAKAVKEYKEYMLRRGIFECEFCGWEIPDRALDHAGAPSRGRLSVLAAHHIIPTATGGTDDRDNLVLLCPNHHAIAHIISRRNGDAWLGPRTKNDLLIMLRAVEAEDDEYKQIISDFLRPAIEALNMPELEKWIES